MGFSQNIALYKNAFIFWTFVSSLHINRVFNIGAFPVKFIYMFKISFIKFEKSPDFAFLYNPGDKSISSLTLFFKYISSKLILFLLNNFSKYLLIFSISSNLLL